MGNHQQKLALRRQTLLLKIQAERSLMTIHCNELKQSLGMADVAVGLLGKAGQIARQRPLLGGLAVAAVLVLKPRRLFSFAKSALLGWETWRSVATIVQRMRADTNN